MTTYSATYSPEDNKLRLCASDRLDADLYARVRAAGFIWAAKQGIFVAPMWTPARADLLIELCGDIGDEDTSLVERAEERAERFDGYRDNRQADAERARGAVARLADNIPLGQPILVGHHSERHARKDAARIENGMRKAVQLWDTAEYWQQRAAAALRNAEYKERPDVRARRIKTIEADKRRQVKALNEAERKLRLWNLIETPNKFKRLSDGATLTTIEEAAQVAADHAGFDVLDAEKGTYWSASDVLRPDGERYQACPAYTPLQLLARARTLFPKSIAHCQRWIAHYDHRLAYERAMIADAGGLVAERHHIEVGGRVLVRGEWVTVLKVNKVAGKINSLSTNRRYVSKISMEKVDDYQAPTAAQAETVKAAVKKPSVYNYPGEGFIQVTQAQWNDTSTRYRGTREVHADKRHERHAARMMIGCFANPKETDANKRHAYVFVFITDAKRKDPPKLAAGHVPDTQPAIPAPTRAAPFPTANAAVAGEAGGATFEALREQLKAGVQVVSVAQLFPTPYELATRMVELARLPMGARVLEPSAGTGAILQALPGVMPFAGNRQTACEVVAFEINATLAQGLKQSGLAQTVICADFLQCAAVAEKFDAVLMNPPFANAEDIKHITHALTMLKPGGRLVAICANGPRQQAVLGPLVAAQGGTWEDLPAGTFQVSGTGVNAALLTLTA